MHSQTFPTHPVEGGSKVLRRPGRLGVIGSDVPAFVDECLQQAAGASLAAKDLRAAYEAWCARSGYEALTQPKLAAELKALGYGKWKSCGLIRYRNLEIAGQATYPPTTLFEAAASALAAPR